MSVRDGFADFDVFRTHDGRVYGFRDFHILELEDDDFAQCCIVEVVQKNVERVLLQFKVFLHRALFERGEYSYLDHKMKLQAVELEVRRYLESHREALWIYAQGHPVVMQWM